MKKIEEIEKMVRTGKIGGIKKDILLRRGQESLGEAAKRVYLGKEPEAQNF